MKITGKTVSGEIAIGKILVYHRKKTIVEEKTGCAADTENRRFQEAVKKIKKQLEDLYEEAVSEVGVSDAAILRGYQIMLDDPMFMDEVHDRIVSGQISAEFAVAKTRDRFAALFSGMSDEYTRARSADIIDISNQVISELQKNTQKSEKTILRMQENPILRMQEDPVILVADDLSPCELLRFKKEHLLGIATCQGTRYSHTAILAKTMQIPCLAELTMGAEEDPDRELDRLNGQTGILDGDHGRIYVNPDEALLKEYLIKCENQEQALLEFQHQIGQKDITRDGKKIRLYANLTCAEEVEEVLKNDAAGIGLFRTEFLFLQRDEFPDEEEQFRIYRSIAEAMKGKKVIIRTIDLGNDKWNPEWGKSAVHEENSAMGCRGIRICLQEPELFKTQLRAILRAGAYGNLSVMYPMIISVEEVRTIKEMVETVKQELTQQGILYGQVDQGIMIETPAAVWISDELAGEVDFFSIGTNDLTQFLLAVDRQNSLVRDRYDACHPAVFRAIRMTVENAHKNGIWAGICGELASDLSVTEQLLKLGIDELSVNPENILPLRKQIRRCTVENR